MTTTTAPATAQLAEGAARAERSLAEWTARPMFGRAYLAADRLRAIDAARYGAAWNRDGLARLVGAEAAADLIAEAAARL